jgi:hypothetical protein
MPRRGALAFFEFPPVTPATNSITYRYRVSHLALLPAARITIERSPTMSLFCASERQEIFLILTQLRMQLIWVLRSRDETRGAADHWSIIGQPQLK